jgi:outer membrane protein assembly factor BamB
VIYKELVIVQVDRHRDSFLAAYHLADGTAAWRVARDEKPVWATPLLHSTPERDELVVMGGDFDRGYDPASGQELWRFARDLEVKTTTPITYDDLILLSGGYRGRPIHALRAGRSGDLSTESAGASGPLAWVSEPVGPYTSTPVAYRGRLYFARNEGIFTVLSLTDGSLLHRARTESTYSASPLASDGRIYLAGEEGVVAVIGAEPPFEVLASNDVGASCMATPAVSDGVLFLRCGSHLWAIGS